MQLVIFWIILSLIGQILCGKICYQNERIACCSGYTWNKTTKDCERCPAGYTGVECIYQCGFPSYGLGCEEICDCSGDLCHFMFGCKLVTKAVIESTIPKIKQSNESSHVLTTGYNLKTTIQLKEGTETSSTSTFREGLGTQQLYFTERGQAMTMTITTSNIGRCTLLGVTVSKL